MPVKFSPRWLLLLIGGVLLIMLIAAAVYLFTPHPYHHQPTALAGESEINILLIGKDARALNPVQDRGGLTRIPREKAAHADNIVICHINLESTRVNLLAIPRDLLVIVPGVTQAESKTDFTRMEKITHTYAIGGEPLLRQTLENLLGVKIHRFLELDFDTFRMVFRLLRSFLGPIALGPVQLRDPDQALKFVRRRYGLRYDDLDRCRNTLNLIKTVAIRLWPLADTRLSDIILRRLFTIIGTATDLTLTETKQLISQLRHQGFKPDRLRLAVLVSEGRPVTLDRYLTTLSCYLPIYPEIEKQIGHFLKDQDATPALDFMTQQTYPWPSYMTREYDLLPRSGTDSIHRQELIKKLLQLTPEKETL